MTKFEKIDIEGNKTETEKMTLAEIQQFCGGYVSAIGGVREGTVIIFNEEGELRKMPMNKGFPAFFGNIIVTDDKEWK